MQKTKLYETIMRNINKNLFSLNEAFSDEDLISKRENIEQTLFKDFINAATAAANSYKNIWKDPFTSTTHELSYWDSVNNTRNGLELMLTYFFKHLMDNLTCPKKFSEENKMSKYRSGGSNPERIAKACQDNIYKLFIRYIIAQEMNWQEAIEAFYPYVYDLVSKLPAFTEYVNNKVNSAIEFENNVDNADTTQYAPTARDWAKMIDYMNRKSDPGRLAQSCKDNNKIIARYIIAKAMKWTVAACAFKIRALDLGILDEAQLEAYARKYATYNAPAEYQTLIDELVQNDEKGGIAQVYNNGQMSYMQEFDKCSAIKSYEWIKEEQLWKLITYNDNVYYCDLNKNFRGLNVYCTLKDENKKDIITEHFGPTSFHGRPYGQRPMTLAQYLQEVVEFLDGNLN